MEPKASSNIKPSSNRQDSLVKWLQNDCQISIDDIKLIANDASFRRYFRIFINNQTYVAMDAPKEFENCENYIRIGKYLLANGIRCPEIYHANLNEGFLLITDFGDVTFLKALNQNNVRLLYQKALQELCQLVTLKENLPILPLFDSEFMNKEWEWHTQWVIQTWLKTDIHAFPKLTNCYEMLIQSVDAQPKVFMHRDFHSANLMVLPKHDIGVLDFQDAFIGPITYDLVSLLRDCYINWPNNLIVEFVLKYLAMLKQKNICTNISEEIFLKWFDWMGVQRHLKALLTFARKAMRDSQTQYLQFVPRTLNYLQETTAQYHELAPIHEYVQFIRKMSIN